MQPCSHCTSWETAQQTGSRCCYNKVEGWEAFLLLCALQSKAGMCWLSESTGARTCVHLVSLAQCLGEGGKAGYAVQSFGPPSIILISNFFISIISTKRAKSTRLLWSEKLHFCNVLCRPGGSQFTPQTSSIAAFEASVPCPHGPAPAGTERELNVLMGKKRLVQGPEEINSPTRH